MVGYKKLFNKNFISLVKLTDRVIKQ